MSKKVTIQDIADELGISRNTVSKAFNNAEGLAPATREKIIQKAMEMDYKQFSYVKALAGISSPGSRKDSLSAEDYGEIALLTASYISQSHFASLMLDKFQRELVQLGYTLNTHRVSEEDLKNKTLPITLVKERIKGIVCIEMFDIEYGRMICDLGLPTLFVDTPANTDGNSLAADRLYMDNTSQVVCFINEMLKRGYKKIGWIGNHEHCMSFFERYLSYRLAILLATDHLEERFIISSNDPAVIKEKLLSLKDLPEVFLCANDFIAIDAMNILRQQGISVPEDVLFCGFDDSHESRHNDPPLTTIHIHTQIMAYEAIHLLISRIKEPSLDYRMVYTQTDLIFRASTKD